MPYTVYDKKFTGLKFGESANKSVRWNKVWRIHPELQDIRLNCAIGK